MKKFYLLFLGLVVVLAGCHFPPELENRPNITFNDVYFTGSAQTIFALVLDFDFEDGDGDIGLDDSFKDLKFQEYWYVLDDIGNKIRIGNEPYNQRDFVIEYKFENGVNIPVDTFRVVRNENHYNLFINIYILDNQGKPQLYDPWKNLQRSFNARIPVMRRDGKATEGNIKYKWESYMWPYMFPNETIQVEFYIKDRALNASNKLMTPPFKIRDLMN